MTEAKEIKTYPTTEATVEALASDLLQIISNSGRQKFNLALSGGNSPKILFDIMAGDYFAPKIPWECIHFWWGDERCVPPNNDDSNFKMAKEHLFDKIKTDLSHIHRIKGELVPEEACREYSREISMDLHHKNGLPVFDLILLGMGTDGHTASIFPDQMGLLDSENICEVATFPATGQKRVTLTGKVINNAERILFLVTGEQKKERVSEIIGKKDSAFSLPSYHICPEHGQLTYYFDKDAASEIRKG